jgi:hypothetical protein
VGIINAGSVPFYVESEREMERERERERREREMERDGENIIAAIGFSPPEGDTKKLS